MSQSCYQALILMLAVFLVTGTAGASIESKQFENSETEARYKKMIAELRCLVCQNQNLSDSDADLAKDLRNQVEKMLKSGNSDEQIVDYMVTRYGDFILYSPPLKTSTLVLWAGPFLMVTIGIIGGVSHFIIIKAFSYTTASTAAPFSYTQLIWTAIFGFIVFGDFPDNYTIFGALIIVGSGLYILYRERVKNKEAH